MKVRINGYVFENNKANRLLLDYDVPDWLKVDADIYTYLRMCLEKSGWEKYLFSFNRIQEKNNAEE